MPIVKSTITRLGFIERLWNSLSETGKDALTAAVIIIPAMVFVGIVRIWTDWNFTDAVLWLLGRLG